MAESEQVREVVEDLAAEQESLDAIVAHITAGSWHKPTPAVGWDVCDQIGHLTFFDERATLAITDTETFAAELSVAVSNLSAYMDGHLTTARASTHAEGLAQWRRARQELDTALKTLGPRDRVPWYGPDMAARTFASARLMEVWAHGQDVVDALGVTREPTTRLRHIAMLGFRTFGWSFAVNGLPIPESTVRVELAGPGGAAWVWGEETSHDSVSGSAEDFCLVVTQRRNITDTTLEVSGDVAARWMQIAQAFAGPPGQGREPLA